MTPSNPDQPSARQANWHHRLIAFLIDAAILIVIFWVSFWIIAPDLNLSHGPSATFAEVFNSYLSALFTTLVWSLLILLVIWGGLLEGKWGRTPGKAAAGLNVVSADDHNQTIGFWGGVAREIVRSIPFLYLFLNEIEFSDMALIPEAEVKMFLLLGPCLVFLLINHLWLRRNKGSQTLHDKFANSHVISTRLG